MSRKSITFEVQNYRFCRTVFDISTDTELDGVHARVSVSTGACHLQTYATREELRALADARLAAAAYAEMEAA